MRFCYEEDVVYLDRIETEEIRKELHMHVHQLYHNMDRPVLGPSTVSYSVGTTVLLQE